MTREAESAIENSRVLVGGRRLLETIACPAGARIVELPDGMADAVSGVLERELPGDVTLVVSGDPGFYSLAKKVTSRFGKEQVSVIPGVSSVQIMAARLRKSWAGVASATLHGGTPGISELVEKMAYASSLVVLLGAADEVASQIEWMASRHELASAWAAIGWDLGLPGERILEFPALKQMDAGSHKGRLALLWLERHTDAADGQ
jgi:precorrin-6Y C5,15-methyltransferase (decarboxylating)